MWKCHSRANLYENSKTDETMFTHLEIENVLLCACNFPFAILAEMAEMAKQKSLNPL